VPLIEFSREELDAVASFIEDYAPDTNLGEDWDFDTEKIKALDTAYDKMATLRIYALPPPPGYPEVKR
jgi:hypothetical protein